MAKRAHFRVLVCGGRRRARGLGWRRAHAALAPLSSAHAPVTSRVHARPNRVRTVWVVRSRLRARRLRNRPGGPGSGSRAKPAAAHRSAPRAGDRWRDRRGARARAGRDGRTLPIALRPASTDWVAISSRMRLSPSPDSTRLLMTDSLSASTKRSGDGAGAWKSSITSRRWVLGSGATIQGRPAMASHGASASSPAQARASSRGRRSHAARCLEIRVGLGAEVEAGVERSAAHPRQRIARHHLRELELDLRIEIAGAHHEIADAQHGRFEDGAELRLPVGSPRSSCAECFRCSTALMICSDSASRRRPDGVRLIPDDERSKSVTPKPSSSALMCPETAAGSNGALRRPA